MRIRIALLAGMVSLGSSAFGQGTRLLRQPTVSATQVAFTYAGDIWIAGRDGGDARRLTSFPGVESDPQLSPDGKWVAFTGSYGDNPDVYVVEATGGQPVRLTWHPRADIARGWTPDGKRVVFASTRYTAPIPIPRLWSIPVAGGLPEALPLPEAFRGTLSPDGLRLVYERGQRWEVEFRNYRGGQNGPLRIITLADAAMTKLPTQGAQETYPVWMGNAIYYLSDNDFATNLYVYDLGSSQARQLTHYKDYDIKSLSGGGGVLVFDVGGYLHIYSPATNQDRQLAIAVRGDLPWAQPRWTDVAKSISSAALSPTGKRALFESRGEIFTVPIDKGDARNLTRTPGTADRSPAWSPDGMRLAWLSDAGGEYQMMIGGQEGLEPARAIPLPQGVRFGYDMVWSPDGKSIAFVDQRWRVWVMDVAAGTTVQADADRFAAPDRTIQPVWSPDSKWLAYAKRLTTHFHSVMAYSVAERKVHQVTDGLSDAISPSWDPSGKYLYFLASTDLSLASGWLDMSSYERHVRRGAYVAVLRADLPSPLLPESDEETAPKDTTAAPKPDAKPGKDAKPASDTTPVRIDWPGIGQRILALGLPIRDYGVLVAGTTGVVFIAENAENQTGATLQRYDLKKRKAEVFLSGVQQFSLSADGKKLLYQSGPAWAVVGTEQVPKPGDGKLAVALPMRLDPRAEWRQIYKEAWRIERDFLYVDNMHGADWDAVFKRYEPWVESVGHRSDLTYILDVLGGELSLAHTFTGGGDEPSAADSVKIGQLGVDLTPDGTRYRITRIYTGENWNPDLRAPLSAPGVKAAVGNYLLAINGVELRVPTDPSSLLEGTADRQTVLRLNDRPTLEGSWTVTVVPVESEGGLRTRAWVEDNRRKVDSLSGGKLAYVWLPNTAEDGYTYFNRYYFSQQDREGAVIDERFNGGGSIADYFVQIMSRKLQGYFNNPIGEHTPFYTPQAGILGPKVMLVNELAGSGGDMLPYLFRQMNIGPLIGARTWGGLVGIWGAPPLIDGGGITAPRGGFYNLKGEWDVENVGVTPDIEVEQTPREMNAGHDPQLERAVAEAMKLLKTGAVKLLPEPPPPVRVKRPPQ